jgi:hypothetical protein
VDYTETAGKKFRKWLRLLAVKWDEQAQGSRLKAQAKASREISKVFA